MSQHQQFNGTVDQVAAGDIKNFYEAPKVAKEPLVKAQRKRLNVLVAEIAEECDVPGQALWLEVLHPQLGVESINEISRSQFQAALDALELFRLNHRNQNTRQDLEEKVQRMARQKNIVFELGNYCTREFGEAYLHLLGREELRKALAFVDDYVVAAKPAGQVASAPFSLAGFMQLAIAQPGHLGVVLVVGIVIGRIF
ncbi:MAG: hypothetical protein ACLGID_18335 [Gammaproteobacteria bacterium]